MKAEHVKNRTALLFVSACRKVTAVRLRLQAFGRKRSRSEQAAAVTKSPYRRTRKHEAKDNMYNQA